MSNQPDDSLAITPRTEWLTHSAGEISVYVTAILGYCATLLLTPALNGGLFLALTIANALYLAIVWWTWREARKALPAPGIVVAGLVGVTLLTSLVGVLTARSTAFDWLLYFATASLYLSLLPTRLGLLATTALYCSMLGLAWLNNWPALSASAVSFLAGFGFVGAFSYANRLLITERARSRRLLRRLEESNQKLEAAHRQVRAYADEVEELAVARERTRMAREIHDTLGHYLTILSIQLETIAKLQERDPARAAGEVVEARRVAAQSMQEVRNAVAALRPAGLGTVSLREALTGLGNEFTHVAEGTALTLDLDTPLPPLAPDQQLAVYRATQEALTNVRKHAQATKVLVRLRYEDGTLELVVVDNGIGPAPAAGGKPAGGFGLIGLRERIELLGGEVTVEPAAPSGCRVAVRLPVAPAPTAPAPALIAAQDGAR